MKRRIGRITRAIDVPLCRECAHILRRLSGEEERLLKLGKVVGILLFFVVLAFAILFSPAELNLALRLLLALATALLVAIPAYSLFKRAGFRAALPAKKEIYHSIHIARFSWRATTFEFANETFAERFKKLNQSRLMEI